MSQHKPDSQIDNQIQPTTNRLRVGIAFALPLVGGIIAILLASDSLGNERMSAKSALMLLLGPIGIISWLLGLRWYGLPGLGLRGKRPLFSGIGFAVLGWFAFLILRLFVSSRGLGTGFQEFVFLLLFEAFCVQLWAFGLMFHSLADWRGPLTAAIASGIFFGAVALLLFQNSYIAGASSFVYFSLWGIFYGVIRLRTGSILGTVIVQAIQSFTGWVVLQPVLPRPDVVELQTFYLGTGVAYLLLTWRLWPKREDDYRV
jgi:membrane protease YdiL (CAAX protease family)